MIHQYKVELQERERGNDHLFQERIIRNLYKTIREEKKVKIKNIVINTKLSKSCYVMW